MVGKLQFDKVKKMVIILCLMTASIAAQAQTYKLGDIDRDNELGITDVMLLVDIILNGYAPFSVEPTSVNMPAGESANVCIFGGYEEYEVVSNNTDIVEASLTGNVITLTAVAAGEATVTVKDVLTLRTIDIPVNVSNGAIKLSANELSLAAGEEGTVDITSGSGNYSVQSSDMSVAYASLEGSTVYVTGVGGGTATVTVTDTESGLTQTIDVSVEYFPLTLSATSLTLDVGEQSTVNITSGNGSFVVRSNNTSVATATLTGFSVKVTAVAEGTAAITVTDIRSGQTASFEVSVFHQLTLSTSSLSLLTGNTATVEITSGCGNYSVKSNDTGTATATISNNSVVITAINAGLAVVTVTDTSSGQTATISLTVTHPTCPDGNHPHMIDLGLPSGTKWSCCNVGSNMPEGYGWYYAWGETDSKTTYNWSTYKHCFGKIGTCYDLGTSISGTKYDVAYVKWNGSRQMPTKAQCDELFSNCTRTYMYFKNVRVCKFTSNVNGNSIMLPFAGYMSEAVCKEKGNLGYYWTSTKYADNTNCAYSLGFGGSNPGTGYAYRYEGRPIRPVAK